MTVKKKYMYRPETGTLDLLSPLSKLVTLDGISTEVVAMISKCQKIIWNDPRNLRMYVVHAPTEGNSWIKYEQDPWDIVGCRGAMRVGWTDRRKDRQIMRPSKGDA